MKIGRADLFAHIPCGKLTNLCFVYFQSYIATQIMVDSKMLRGHRQDGKYSFFGF